MIKNKGVIFLKIYFCTFKYVTGNKQDKSGTVHFQRSKPDSVIFFLNDNQIINERKYYGKN